MSRSTLPLKKTVLAVAALPATMGVADLKAASLVSGAATMQAAKDKPTPVSESPKQADSLVWPDFDGASANLSGLEDACTVLGLDAAQKFYRDGEATATNELQSLTAFRDMTQPYINDYAKFRAVARVWASGYASAMGCQVASAQRIHQRRMEACDLTAPVSMAPDAIAKRAQRQTNMAKAQKVSAENKAIIATVRGGGTPAELKAAAAAAKGLAPVPPRNGGAQAKLTIAKLTAIEIHIVDLFRRGEYKTLLEIIGSEQAKDGANTATAKAAVSSAKVTRAPALVK